MDEQTRLIRSVVRGGYDIQALRISMGNRIYSNFRAKLGLKSTDKEKMDKEATKILTQLRKDYDRITDGITDELTPRKFKAMGIIDSYGEYVLIHSYLSLRFQEAEQFKHLNNIMSGHPLYEAIIADKNQWVGIGPMIIGLLISELDLSKPPNPTGLWKYCGLDVAPDGRGRSKRKEHLVEWEYTDKEGKKQKRLGVTYKPLIKSKLMGVLSTSLIKQNGKPDKNGKARALSPYRTIYDVYKHRISNMEEHADKSDGHIEMMAKRYMIKMFLRDLYKLWRPLLNLPISEPYEETKIQTDNSELEPVCVS